MNIEKVAVIGAGVMGSGIAAHLANAGVDVILLDIVPKDAEDRSIIAKSAIQKMLKAKPAPFMHKRDAKKITPGNIEDDMKLIKDVDWVIEVVLENLEIKHTTYQKIEKHRKKGSIVSSNTSTIPLEKLTEGFSKDFKEHFMVTHFFNPPRYMPLLEIVTSDDTKKEVKETIKTFCDVRLGKGVVECHDTPGFIANRIGTFWLQAAINAAFDMNMSIEDADAVMGKPIGVPKTGVFALVDLVGIDLMPHLSESLLSSLPEGDEYRNIHRDFDLIDQMIKDGYTGRKGKGGFYRLNKEGGKRVKEAIDLKSGDYKPAKKSKMACLKASKKDGMRGLVAHDDMGGKYAWTVLSQVLSYAASLVPEIVGDIKGVDDAMKMGYNWKYGPFEMMDKLGPAWFVDRLKSENKPVPVLLEQVGQGTFYKEENGKLHFFGIDGQYHEVIRDTGVLLLSDVKRASKPVSKNKAASLWDIGDGVLCLEFHSKMNMIDNGIFDQIENAITLIGNGSGTYKTLVIHNEASNFSVGANLVKALGASLLANIGLSFGIRNAVKKGQSVYKKLKFAPFPVVGAPSGMALGGGCEVLLHCDAIQAHAETYIGLVEVGVGIIPGWGGCKEMLIRHAQYGKQKGVVPPAINSFQTIGTAKVATSAKEAFDLLLFLNKRDDITMNKSRVLFDAKQKALSLIKGYEAPQMQEIRLPGPAGKLAMDMAVADLRQSGKVTPHDVTVSAHLATVLSGGNHDMTEVLNEDQLLDIERTEFVKLAGMWKTFQRIKHMVFKKKPLRN